MSPTPPSSPFPGGSRPGGTGAAGNKLATPTPSGFIGRYQILEQIGEGGMGSLYLARDPAIDRLVAIKVLRRGFDTEALRERFTREARAAGRLRHPNIVTIFDVGEHDGDPFIAMEFLAGETLGELVRHGAGLSLSRRLKLLEELCDGLAYAHRAGMVHRDIKPANLMVDAEGVLKILDFGIVRVGDSGMTQAGVLVGTINYMSPEQVLGTGVDHRSDIFAVGLVAYELLSGKQAFVGTMKDGLLRRIPNAEIAPLSGLVPDLDAEVVKIVEHALQKEPGDRYQELARMRNDLTRVRQRIEVEEERAALEAASASAETALIAEEVTAPGVPMESPGRSTPGFSLLADAERALAEGNYRFALSMAGRAAALNPQDRNPSTIVARAEAALLDRGRTFESSQSFTPRSGSSMPEIPAPVPPASTPPVSTVTTQRANYLAVAVAVVALLVAGFAVWSQVGRSDPAPAGDGAGQAPPAAGNQATGPGPEQSSPPAAGAPPTGSPAQTDSSPAADAKASEAAPRGGDSGRQPERSVARGSEPQGGATGAASSSRRTQETPRRPQRGASERQQPPPGEPQKNTTPERASPPPVTRLPTTQGVSPGAIPGASAPRPVTPPPPAPPPSKPSKPPEPKVEAPPPRDPRAEARTAVESVLRRYEAAWEALDFNALARVWDMSDPRGVRSNMEDFREYAMDVTVQNIDIASDTRHATAVCRITHRFRGAVSGLQTQVRTSTFSFEKRGDNWLITGLR